MLGCGLGQGQVQRQLPAHPAQGGRAHLRPLPLPGADQAGAEEGGQEELGQVQAARERALRWRRDRQGRLRRRRWGAARVPGKVWKLVRKLVGKMFFIHY